MKTLMLLLLGSALLATSAFAGVNITINPYEIAQVIHEATQATPGRVYQSKPVATSPAQKKRRKSTTAPNVSVAADDAAIKRQLVGSWKGPDNEPIVLKENGVMDTNCKDCGTQKWDMNDDIGHHRHGVLHTFFEDTDGTTTGNNFFKIISISETKLVIRDLYHGHHAGTWTKSVASNEAAQGLSLAATVGHSDDDAAWKAVKSVQETPSKEDAEDAAEEAKYLSELTEVIAKNDIAKPEQEAQQLIKYGKDLEARENQEMFAFEFWEAAKVWLTRGIPPSAVRDLMAVYGNVMTGLDPQVSKVWDYRTDREGDPDHDLVFGGTPNITNERIDPATGLMDWDNNTPTLNKELPELISDAISGKREAAKRLHVTGLENLQPKDRCARIIQVLTKRYKARADRVRAEDSE